MPNFGKWKSRKFRLRSQAEAWAKKEKTLWKDSGLKGAPKIDINFLNNTNEWEAVLLAPVD